ncbi:predicted sulfurylase large subunit, molybdopterin cytosine dinucleotide biosynthesis /predicted sulfurylase small subunit, molybdopterin cytosine dinucleotide biosynthesis [Cupriavidus sp. YR651]|uniref:XdhC family protein n=1 Tax=Cupriavidus sp. YR651 TaxID=1855315 RepID=UPI000880BDF0|nr:XdhC family protein [Cupriavidus sp. YR651]SDD24661.1 predicted sulfurylase large subunit, molybdopterin cytosine dinucleotide biosynthesis /predicted sulfurylase small subunit, molybdopterin cytosine dinucleotide biosynthesis [Cupriavidus sp. YR651]
MNTDSPDSLLQREQRLIEQAQPFAVVTVIRAAPPTSAWVGAQALVEPDGTLHGWIGGGCSRAIVIEAALQAIRSGQPKRVRISNEPAAPDADVEAHTMPCASNGALELFIQPSLPAPVVLVLGATPTALEACVLAKWVGFRVCAAAGATAPFASLGLKRVIQGFDVDAFNLAGPQLILVVTQGESDEDALEAALRSEAAAVLLVASERKADRLRDAMRLRGITAQRLAALHAPAGPSIHAHKPQEIALGAVAGLVALRHELEQSVADAGVPPLVGSEAVPALPPCESMASVEAPGARYVNPVCGMAIDIAAAKHVLSYGGQRFYFCCDSCKIEFERDPGKYLAIAQGATHGEKT